MMFNNLLAGWTSQPAWSFTLQFLSVNLDGQGIPVVQTDLVVYNQGGLIYGEGIQDENMTLKEAKYDTISSSENGGRSRGFSDFFFKKRFFILFFR